MKTIKLLRSGKKFETVSADEETNYLRSIPSMVESIKDGLTTPIEECASELIW